MLFSDVVVMAAPLFSFPFPVVASMPVIVGVRLTVRLVLVHSGSFDEFLLLFVISIQFEKKLVKYIMVLIISVKRALPSFHELFLIIYDSKKVRQNYPCVLARSLFSDTPNPVVGSDADAAAV